MLCSNSNHDEWEMDRLEEISTSALRKLYLKLMEEDILTVEPLPIDMRNKFIQDEVHRLHDEGNALIGKRMTQYFRPDDDGDD